MDYTDGYISKSKKLRAQKEALALDIERGSETGCMMAIDDLVAKLFDILPGTPRGIMAMLLEERGETRIAEALKKSLLPQPLGG